LNGVAVGMNGVTQCAVIVFKPILRNGGSNRELAVMYKIFMETIGGPNSKSDIYRLLYYDCTRVIMTERKIHHKIPTNNLAYLDKEAGDTYAFL
jgi:hypothetical protein